MSGDRVLILGAGFGGLSAAHVIAKQAPSAELLLVDRSPDFVMGLRKLWTLDGRSGPADGRRARASLGSAGIEFRQATVNAIDLEGHTARIGEEEVAWDHLVVALGCEGRPDLVPGGLGGNPDLYTFEGAAQAGAAVAAQRSGRVVILIAGVPIKCPPGPYEAAFLVDHMLRRSGVREQVAVEVITPQPMSIPAAGVVACNSVESQLSGRGIEFRPNAKITRVETGRVVLEDGTVDADVLMVVPPHRPPSVVAASGLPAEGPFIPVDPGTLATSHPGVYAIGDVTEMKTGSGLPFPKAGVFAERHGVVVGENIAARINGTEPVARFEGDGYCFLEVGGGSASSVRGNFLTSPPTVMIADPSPANLEAKQTFETERLARWFPL
ncbi:MAG: NAD(P)/FAD-dependent oxidoreductase [Candidatus Dormibacteria bacterium]